MSTSVLRDNGQDCMSNITTSNDQQCGIITDGTNQQTDNKSSVLSDETNVASSSSSAPNSENNNDNEKVNENRKRRNCWLPAKYLCVSLNSTKPRVYSCSESDMYDDDLNQPKQNQQTMSGETHRKRVKHSNHTRPTRTRRKSVDAIRDEEISFAMRHCFSAQRFYSGGYEGTRRFDNVGKKMGTNLKKNSRPTCQNYRFYGYSSKTQCRAYNRPKKVCYHKDKVFLPMNDLVSFSQLGECQKAPQAPSNTTQFLIIDREQRELSDRDSAFDQDAISKSSHVPSQIETSPRSDGSLENSGYASASGSNRPSQQSNGLNGDEDASLEDSEFSAVYDDFNFERIKGLTRDEVNREMLETQKNNLHLIEKIDHLEQENFRLKSLLDQHGIDFRDNSLNSTKSFAFKLPHNGSTAA